MSVFVMPKSAVQWLLPSFPWPMGLVFLVSARCQIQSLRRIGYFGELKSEEGRSSALSDEEIP